MDIDKLPDKISDITNLAVNASLNAKTNEVKDEIPSITVLATTAVLTTFENGIDDLNKYITTPEFNKLTANKYFYCNTSTSKFSKQK